MQITINVPDNLPKDIVQQYIENIEAQMKLISKLTVNKTTNENKTQRASLEKLLQIADECSQLPVLDSRPADK